MTTVTPSPPTRAKRRTSGSTGSCITSQTEFFEHSAGHRSGLTIHRILMTRLETNVDVGPASRRRVIPLRRRLLFLFLVVAVLGVVQEVVYRLAFPFPEVMNFNRNHYVRVYLND